MPKRPLKGDKIKITPVDPTADAIDTGHPLLRNAAQATDILKRMQGMEKAQEFKIHQIEEWKAALNRVASTPDGQLFITAMIQFSGYHNDDAVINATKMVEDKGKQAFYKRWVRPYLDPLLRKEIE